MEFNYEIVLIAIFLVVLISIQSTLNKILVELKNIDRRIKEKS